MQQRDADLEPLRHAYTHAADPAAKASAKVRRRTVLYVYFPGMYRNWYSAVL